MTAYLPSVRLLPTSNSNSLCSKSLRRILLRSLTTSLTIHTLSIQRLLPEQLVLSIPLNWCLLVVSIRNCLSLTILHPSVRLRRSSSMMVARNMHLASTMTCLSKVMVKVQRQPLLLSWMTKLDLALSARSALLTLVKDIPLQLSILMLFLASSVQLLLDLVHRHQSSFLQKALVHQSS